VAKQVTLSQTNSGTKDKYTLHTIQKLLSWSKAKKKANPHLTYQVIGTELDKWWQEHEDTLINPFLRTKGDVDILV
jgi:hypothetical protein